MREEYETNRITILHQQHRKVSRYSWSFFYKETISLFQQFHKCSILLKVDYLQITPKYQPICIPHKRFTPIPPIETIDSVPPTPPISSYLTKSDTDKIIKQASDLLSMSEQYTAHDSSSLLSSIKFRELSIPEFNNPLIFYQFKRNIQPIIHQASDLLSI